MSPLLFALLTLLFFIGFWSRRYRVVRPSDHIITCKTKDGIYLPLWVYRPTEQNTLLPVVLCHGMCAGRMTWDLADHSSWVRYLTKQGYQVYVPELRGTVTASQLNDQSSGREYWNFDFDTIADMDVPAIVSRVLAHSGKEKLHWIGHSMGGMAVFANANSGLTEKLASFCTLGSPASFEWAVRRSKILARIGSAIPWNNAPLKLLGQIFASLAGLIHGYIQEGPINTKNVTPKDLHVAVYNIPDGISRGLLAQARLWMESGQFVDRNKRPILPRLAAGNCPALFIAGEADTVAHPNAVKVAFESWGHPEKTYRLLSIANGVAFNYAHQDLTIGSQVQEDVLPLIDDWLQKHGTLRTVTSTKDHKSSSTS